MSRAKASSLFLVVILLLLGVFQAVAAPLAHREVWPNGLVFLAAERPAIPIVILQLYVRAGSAFDPPDRPGLANLTAELLTRGTKQRTANQIDEAIEFVGGSLEGDAGRDGTVLSLSILKKDLRLGLDLLAEVLLHPAFPNDELQRKVKQLQGAIKQSDDQPESVAARAMARLLFPGHPYGHPVVGTIESIGKVTREEVERFYRRRYRPDSAVLVVVGDVRVSEIRQELQQRLGAWARPQEPFMSPKEANATSPARVEVIQRDLTQTTLLLALPSVRRNHPDYFTLQVANYILGGGSASRLYTHLRERQGFVYFVGSHLDPGKYGGEFVINLQTRTETTKEALQAVREELARLGREQVTSDELALAKSYLIGSFPLRMDTNSKVASLLSVIEENQLGLEYPDRFRQKIAAVTAEAIQRAARTHLDPQKMSLVVVGDIKKSGFTSEPRLP
jgi:zinc protease